VALDQKSIETVLNQARLVDAQQARFLTAVGELLTSPDVVRLDYLSYLRPRPDSFVFEPVREAIDSDREHWLGVYRAIAPVMDSPQLSGVPERDAGGNEPCWKNWFFERGDARAGYAMVATLRPRVILEIGCGHSTRFMRKAIRDHGLETRIISIDPKPQAEIRPIVDEFIQRPLLDVPMTVFGELRPGDILFFDGSHRALNGSDVTHLFLSVLPTLPPGVLVHVHDIDLPCEYRQMLTERHYSEQYVLAALLLDRARWRTVLPLSWLRHLGISPEGHAGASFWFEARPS